MDFRSIVHGARIFALVACAACDVGLLGVGEGDRRRSIPVHVEIVTPERSTPRLALPGVVEAKSSRVLAFQYAGRIARFTAPQGHPVAVGDPIAEFDLADLERMARAAAVLVEKAQQRLAETERRYGRQRQLFALASDSPAAFASTRIESAVHGAEARHARVVLEAAEARLAAGVLRAPVAGVVDHHYRAAGTVAGSGEPVVRLIELDSVALVAAVPHALRPLVHVGGTAEVRFRAGGERRLRGTIRRVARAADPATGSVRFEVEVENPELMLRPGMVVEVGVDLAGGDAEFSIPLVAVRPGIDDQPFTFVVVESGEVQRIARRRLDLGGLRGDRAVVIAGLQVGDRVVSHGQDLVTVGDVVTIVGEGP